MRDIEEVVSVLGLFCAGFGGPVLGIWLCCFLPPGDGLLDGLLGLLVVLVSVFAIGIFFAVPLEILDRFFPEKFTEQKHGPKCNCPDCHGPNCWCSRCVGP
jgi:hypothetical protein